MKNLKIYYISESYINYLRQFDKQVQKYGAMALAN